MIGNAVPVKFAKQLASVIYKDVSDYLISKQICRNQFIHKLQKEEKILI
jgi:hypothetical protein